MQYWQIFQQRETLPLKCPSIYKHKEQGTSMCLYVSIQQWKAPGGEVFSIAYNSLSSTGPILLNYQMAQMVKNPFAMWETWVRSLVWGEPLEKRTATSSNILLWRIPRTEEPGRLPGVTKSQIRLSNFHFSPEIRRNELQDHPFLLCLLKVILS